MVPVVLLSVSWLTGFSSSANLASLVIRHDDLHEPVAGIVRDTFASASADRAASSVLGVASLAVAGSPWRCRCRRPSPDPGGSRCSLDGFLPARRAVVPGICGDPARGRGGHVDPGRNLGLGCWPAWPGWRSPSCCGGHPAAAARQGPGGLARPGTDRDRRHRGNGGAAAAVAAAAAQVACLLGDPIGGHRHQPGAAVGGPVAGHRLGGGGGFVAVYWERIADQDTIIRAELDS